VLSDLHLGWLMTMANNRLRLTLYYVAMAAAVIFIIADGVLSGWYKWMPGPMRRHRDAIAVAVTAVAYRDWQGGVYRSVEDTLHGYGLDLKNAGFRNIMIDGDKLDEALLAASHLQGPASDGLYYPVQEGGMALFYTASFLLFGIKSDSWFWLYVSLLSISTVIAILTFHRDGTSLILIISAVCATAAVASIAPRFPQIDVISILSNRNLGLLGIVPALHLMLLMALRFRPNPIHVMGALFQAALICFIVIARASALWLVIGVIGCWVILFALHFVARVRATSSLKSCSWPAACLAVGMLGVLAYQKHEDSATGSIGAQHVFWHNFATAIHNNPLRTDRYGIPATAPVYDDLISYTLFERELSARGESRSSYLRHDPDWVYRTTEPQYDLRWAAYDAIMRGIVVRTIISDPLYVTRSTIEQVRSALTILVTTCARLTIYAWPVAVILLLGGLAVGPPPINIGTTILLSVIATAAALPVAFAAVVEFRLIELYVIILFVMASLGLMALGAVSRSLLPSLFARIVESRPR